MTDSDADDISMDGEDSWNLVLFPKFADDEDPDTVKQKLSATLKVDADKVEGWYHAEAPTVLLKGVAKDVADRYMQAILQCGATCNIQQSGQDGGLSLVPKSRNMDFFICPSCEYEEEIPKGTKYEQCPKCGLVIAKWEERMKEEREKEAIRRRLMRDARLKGDREEELKRKRAELERLRKLEREIMLELGIKPPGKLMMFFQSYPFSMSTAFAILIVAMSTVVLFYVNQYLDEQKHEALLAAQPSEKIQQIAPVMADAVKLQQNGNQGTISELADVTTVMRGDSGPSQDQIVKAAQQMMKGADSATFVNVAGKMNPPGTKTQPGPDGAPAQPVNIDTIGGISGLTGVKTFDNSTLNAMSPPLLEHGQERVLGILAEKRMVPDPKDPKKTMIVDELDEMDGSMIVKLMNTLQKDQEWDQFIRGNINALLADGKMDEANSLSENIKNPVVRIRALGDIMVAMLDKDANAVIKGQMNSVSLELDKMSDVDIKATSLLALGDRLAAAGAPGEPDRQIDYVAELIRNSKDMMQKATLSADLAVAYLKSGNRAKARAQFNAAVNMAGRIKDTADRIAAFTRIAKRYYDARDTTLASKILSEAQLLAATQLPVAGRSRVFGEIAIAQGYMGDLAGAQASIDNAGVGEGAQQLQAKLAESLIGLDKFYEAQSVMDNLTDDVEYNRLEVRLISSMLHSGRLEQAKTRLAQVGQRARKIGDPSQRGLVLSQYGRLFARAGMKDEAQKYFSEALDLGKSLSGRKKAVNRGIVALDEARALMVTTGAETLAELKESIVKDPVGSEITSTKRIIKLFPESVQEQAS